MNLFFFAASGSEKVDGREGGARVDRSCGGREKVLVQVQFRRDGDRRRVLEKQSQVDSASLVWDAADVQRSTLCEKYFRVDRHCSVWML